MCASSAGAFASETTAEPTPTTLLWASAPTFANQTVLVWGAGLAGASSATVKVPQNAAAGGAGATDTRVPAPPVLSATPFDVSDTSLKVTLPAALPDGSYELCIHSGGASPPACIDLNCPELWWRRGDVNLTHATAGAGWVRIFGRNFGDQSDPSSRLAPVKLQLCPGVGECPYQGEVTTINAVNGTANEALFLLPGFMTIGEYTLSVDSGGVVFALNETIYISAAGTPPGAWPLPGPQTRVIEVSMCAPHAVSSTCGNGALFAALNATRAASGGVILLQQGVWQFTTETIDLPPFTTLRGVSAGRVSLVWNTQNVNRTDVPKYFVGGNGTFAIEDLTISCTSFYNNLIADGNRRVSDPWVPCKQDAVADCGDETPAWSHSRWVRIRRVRIRADCFFRLVERDAVARRGLAGNFTYEQVGAAIQLNGQEYEITDCDIYASMHGIYLGHNQNTLFNSASVGIVARNTINFGGDCYQIDSSSHVIFEDNECVGINLFSRGSAAGSTYGGPASSFIFFGRNRIRFVFGGDQEELTLDGGFSPYFGKVEASDNSLTFTSDPLYPQWCSPPGHCRDLSTNWTGAAAYVLGGTGQGQLRVFKKGGLAEGLNRTWELEEPFGSDGGVALGADSLISVFERREKCIYRDNLFSDGGPMQLYGGMFHAIVANNTIERASGLIAEGLNHGKDTYMPVYFIETLNNRIIDSISLTGEVAGLSAYGYYNASAKFNGTMAAALVYRNNHVDNGHWSVSGAATDVLIEGNAMVNTMPWNNFSIKQGLLPNKNATRAVNTTARIFLRDNEGMVMPDL